MTTYANPEQHWQRRLAKQFDLIGAGYAGLGRHFNECMYAARLRALEKALAAVGHSFQRARVIEIGCGSGFYADYCAHHGIADYLGLDITEVSITRLRQRFPHFRFEQVDITKPAVTLPSERDIALVADVLFHVIQDDSFAQALSNVCSALAPGGLLIISDIFGPRRIQTAAHVRNRSLDDYRSRLESAGLRIVRVEPIFAVLQPPAPDAGAALPWRAYAWFWRYAWRLARIRLVDRTLPGILSDFDEKIALPRWGMSAPNNKWLLAVKEPVADRLRVP